MQKIFYYAPYDLTTFENGDWIDLRACLNEKEVRLKKFESKIISLGIAMQIPAGFEAIVAARSSTFKNYSIILANGIGVIDGSFCGIKGIWSFHALAFEECVIPDGVRIAQFRLQPSQFAMRNLSEVPKFDFVNLFKSDYDELLAWQKKENRGGFGTTGKF